MEPEIEREPLTDEVEVVVIGGGFGGLLAGARLRQAGVEDIRMIDPAADFGGTWYWNRYPGIACDIESYTYLPLLEEVGLHAQGEVLLRSRDPGAQPGDRRKFDLYRDVCFQTRVEALRWDEDEARWIVTTNRGDRMKAHYVCLATGPLNRPKLPGIPGSRVRGPLVPREPLGLRVHRRRLGRREPDGPARASASASSAPARRPCSASPRRRVAEHLYVFQRTPSSIDVKDNPSTDPEWAKTLEPGWHQHRMDNFNSLVSGVPQEEDLVNDGWTDLIGSWSSAQKGRNNGLLAGGPGARRRAGRLREDGGDPRSRGLDRRSDPATAEALKPYYRQFCKRPCFHNEYLEPFNRPNVTLVDTKGKGVERITKKGVVVEGREYELDCLIYASGFEVGDRLLASRRLRALRARAAARA